MAISRRTFLQTSLAGGTALTAFGFDVAPVYAQATTLKISRTSETRSTCPYCSVSCGVIIHTLGDRAKNAVPQVVHVEGDPDHPDQPRHALSQGRVARAGHPQRSPADSSRKSGAPAPIAGKTSAGTRPSTRSRAG